MSICLLAIFQFDLSLVVCLDNNRNFLLWNSIHAGFILLKQCKALGIPLTKKGWVGWWVGFTPAKTWQVLYLNYAICLTGRHTIGTAFHTTGMQWQDNGTCLIFAFCIVVKGIEVLLHSTCPVHISKTCIRVHVGLLFHFNFSLQKSFLHGCCSPQSEVWRGTVQEGKKQNETKAIMRSFGNVRSKLIKSNIIVRPLVKILAIFPKVKN